MGDVELQEKLGRRDLCPCGSGKIYKRCCLSSGRFDGSNKDDYFQRAPVNPALLGTVPTGLLPSIELLRRSVAVRVIGKRPHAPGWSTTVFLK
ncbi:MAG: SEC-C metal-binding domain-containing protein [Devosia sp.]